MAPKGKLIRRPTGREVLLGVIMAPLVYLSLDQAWYWQWNAHASQMVLRAAVLLLASWVLATTALGLGARLLRRPRDSEAYLGLAHRAVQFGLVAFVLGSLFYYVGLMLGHPLSVMALDDPAMVQSLREDHMGYLGVSAAFRTGSGLLGAGLAWWLIRRERRAGAPAPGNRG